MAVGLSGGLAVTGITPAAAGTMTTARAASAATATTAGTTATGVAELASPRLAPCNSSRPTLRYGSRGAQVRYVQTRLGVQPRSGWFGPITRAAVIRYQRSKRIPATGVVGRLTWRALLCGSTGGGGGGGDTNNPGIPVSVQRLNWRALAQCESGGNPRALNPSGKYRGLYQFDFPTWRSVGGKGDPINNSAREQTYRAQLLYVRRGSAPWPQCGRRLFS